MVCRNIVLGLLLLSLFIRFSRFSVPQPFQLPAQGVPLVYNIKRKCITLLDDESGQDPMTKYDFGPAAQYLFRPCELDDDFFEQVSMI